MQMQLKVPLGSSLRNRQRYIVGFHILKFATLRAVFFILLLFISHWTTEKCAHFMDGKKYIICSSKVTSYICDLFLCENKSMDFHLEAYLLCVGSHRHDFLENLDSTQPTNVLICVG